MIKHVGRHNNKRVVIAYKQVPDEDHMCLVIYSESLPMRIHDEVMKVLESEVGQQANDFADALFRHTMADGVNCLNAIHRGGLLSKVPTNQVIVTPTSASSVRLDELNTILNEMAKGVEATEKLAKVDAGQRFEGRDLGEPAKTTSASVNTTSASVNTDGVLSDADIANQRTAQANKLRADAQGLLAEATRLDNEANALAPKATKAKVTKAKAPTTITPAKKPNARKPATKKAAA
jgi:outer membrane murein-binding lipoprotein Lpp